MTEEKIIRVGIIGCGKIAQVRHIPEYAANPRAKLTGFVDFVASRAEEMAARYGGKAYASEEELLADPEIDAVSVCVANAAHADVTLKALRAGKHVLCEKPMAVTMEQCREMVAQAERSGKYLMIGQNQRFAPAHVKAKQLLESGVIGTVRTFKTCFGHDGPDNWSIDSGTSNWFFDKSKSAFGAFADLGVHKTDLICFLLNSRVAEVQASITTLDKLDKEGRPVEVDDNAVCIYRMESGAVGTMTASWSYYGREDNSTVLYGTEGIMGIYADPQHSIVVHKKDGGTLYYDTDAIQTNACQTNSGIIDAFVDALSRGEEPPVSGREVLASMEAVFAAAEAARTGTTIKLT